jgi:hypothetical protein
MSTAKCALLCWLTAAAADQGTHLTIHQFMLQTPTSASLICLQIPLKTSMVSHQQMLWATKTKLWGRQIHLTADAKAEIELPIRTWSACLSKSSDPCKPVAQDTFKKDKIQAIPTSFGLQQTKEHNNIPWPDLSTIESREFRSEMSWHKVE